MKCLNNDACTCKFCKKSRRYFNKTIKYASTLTEQEVRDNIEKYRSSKYPQTKEEIKDNALSSFWCGVWLTQTYHQDKIEQYKRRIRKEKLIILNNKHDGKN